MAKHICTDSCDHKEKTFLSIHNHSIFSARDCLNHIPALYDKAAENNFEVVITDHGNMGSVVQAFEEAKKRGKKFIAGCEFYVSSNRDRFFEVKNRLETLKKIPASSYSKGEKAKADQEVRLLNFEFDALGKYGHLVAIAKNIDGYHELLEIHNKAFTDYFYKKPLTDYKDYFKTQRNKDGSRNIILTSACLANQINQFIMKDKLDKADDFVQMLKEEYQDDFYIELQANDMDIQKKCNINLIKLARKHDIQMCIANDAHYTSIDDSEAHQILLLLQGGNKIEDRDKMVWQITYETKKGETRRKKVEDEGDFFGIPIESIQVGDYIYKKDKGDFKKYDKEIKKMEKVPKAWVIEAENLTFCTEDEMIEKTKTHEELKDIVDELLDTNKKILEKIENYDLDISNNIPRLENENITLKKLCAEKLIKRKLNKKPEYVARLKKELNIITTAGFSSYFLILEDIYRFVHENNRPRGISRGSAGSSLVAYLLNITLIDPIEYNFPFERFLNLERTGLDLITVEAENGMRFNYLQSQLIKVERDGKEIEITADKLTEDDTMIVDKVF